MLPNNESSFDAGRAEIMMREINLYNESLVRFGSSVQEEFARLADNALKSVIALNSEETNRLVLEIKDIIDQSNVESSKKAYLVRFVQERNEKVIQKKILQKS